MATPTRTRRAASTTRSRRAAGPALGGSEVFLAPHDPGLRRRGGGRIRPVGRRAVPNRDLPASLPFGGGHPRLRLVEGAAAVSRVACLTAPTADAAPATARARRSGGWSRTCRSAICRWSAAPRRRAALKEVLRLYDVRDSAETRAAIDGAGVGVGATRHGARPAGPRRRVLPRPRRDARIRPARLAGRRALSAGRRARPVPRPARHGEQLRPHQRDCCAGGAGSVAAWPPRAGARVLL